MKENEIFMVDPQKIIFSTADDRKNFNLAINFLKDMESSFPDIVFFHYLRFFDNIRKQDSDGGEIKERGFELVLVVDSRTIYDITILGNRRQFCCMNLTMDTMVNYSTDSLNDETEPYKAYLEIKNNSQNRLDYKVEGNKADVQKLILFSRLCQKVCNNLQKGT